MTHSPRNYVWPVVHGCQRPHADCRVASHTWASWLRQSGVDLATIQEMGGWKDPAMTQRYAQLEVAHLRSFARNIDKRLGKIEGALL